MIRFLLRRALSSLVTLFLLATLLFFLVHLIMPGDYVSQFYGMPLAEKEELRRRLGLDLPLVQQYLRWLSFLLRGDLGVSFAGFPVLPHLVRDLWVTLLVFATGLGIAFSLGYWLGRAIAWRGPGLLSDGIALSVTALYALFPPSVAFLLRFFLGEYLDWYPRSPEIFWGQFAADFPAYDSLGVMRAMVISLPAAALLVGLLSAGLRRLTRRRIPLPVAFLLTGSLWIAIWVVNGIATPALRILQLASLPIFAFTLLSTGDVAILTRTSMGETLHEEYVLTARAKGLPPAAIRDRHVARPALLPVLSKLVISLPYLIGGLAIIEYSLQWPGIGTTIFASTLSQDVPMLLGYLLFLGLFGLGARLFLEAAYAYLDPRLRSSTTEVRPAREN